MKLLGIALRSEAIPKSEQMKEKPVDSEYRGLIESRGMPLRSPDLVRLTEVRDATISLAVLYLSVLLYEVGNLISLSAMGFHASIIWSGIFPVGVMGDSPFGDGSSVAKLLQVGICVSATLTASKAVRRKGLPLTSVALAGVTGMYIASLYWEVLSLTSFVPMALHEAIYVTLSVALAFGVLRAFPTVPFAKRMTQRL
jgi:hypothetical protein